MLRLAAQQTGANGVERANGQAAQLPIEQIFHAVLHLLGRFVGEGDGHDTARGRAQMADEVGDAVREHARLTAAWPGNDERGARGGGDGLVLLGVEACEEIQHGVDFNTAA